MQPDEFRRSADLSQYPDLVVIYLGIRAKSLRGVGTILRLGPGIRRAVDAKPDGLLLHEPLLFSLFPLHVGMRQYWRDFDALERFTRAQPHAGWWKEFFKDNGGTAFWHETYSLRGGFESVYLYVDSPVGLLAFAPPTVPTGPMSSARARLIPSRK